jgi:broad-specificity NMP kinase
MKLIKFKNIGYLAWPITDNIECEIWDICYNEIKYLKYSRFLSLLNYECDLLEESLSEVKEDK